MTNEKQPIKTVVCYSPELDEIDCLEKGEAFLFNDNEGPLVLLYKIRGHDNFIPRKYYLIGDL